MSIVEATGEHVASQISGQSHERPGQARNAARSAFAELSAILATDDLMRRDARAADHKGEADALLTLARELSASSQTLLQTLCETVLSLCRAQSAGISILEEKGGTGEDSRSGQFPEERAAQGQDTDAESQEMSCFRWLAVAGEFAPFLNQTMPRDFGPCSIALNANAPQLFVNPGRYLPDMQPAQSAVVECLVAPFHVHNEPAGALWAIKHDAGQLFDPEDARLLTSLATVAGAARQLMLSQSQARRANEVLVEEVAERRESQEKQRAAEAALRASKEALSLAIDAAQLGTFYCDFPLYNIVWSKTCSEHFFLSPDTTVNFELFYSLLHPDDREATRKAVTRCMAERLQYNVEYRTVAPDGRTRWINAIGRGYYDEAGAPYRFDGITIDITEQKARERALNFLVELNDATRALHEPMEIMATATRMLGEALDVSRCAYAPVDADANHFVIYKDWTRECPSSEGSYVLDAFGPRAAHAMRTGHTLVICDRDAEATPDDDLAAFRVLQIQAIICTALIKDGKIAAMMAVHNALPRRWTPHEIALVEMVAERSWAIIERAEAENRLKERAAEIEQLNARLHRSIQETHHRVKNNLQIISALAELQIEDGDTVPVSALKRMGQHTRSLAVIHDLLTQQVKTDAHADSISVSAILGKLIPLLQATVGERVLRYETDDFLMPVKDGASLTLLVSELVSNALKHGEGEITVTLCRQDDAACLTVGDRGRGFAPGFDPRRVFSTGLSLIDSTGRYDLHGTITYENAPDGGAQVCVVFPIAA